MAKADTALLKAAAYSNSFKTLDPRAESTGFRTYAYRHGGLGLSSAPRLADEFLLNTRLRRYDRENQVSIESYFSDASIVMLSMHGLEPDDEQGIALPPGVPLQMELSKALARRRSCRMYTGDAIELDVLASLLRSATTVTAEMDIPLAQGGHSTYRLRTTPSAGGLYPVDIHPVVLNVRGLERGCYRYNPITDKLQKRGDAAMTERVLQGFAVTDDAISLSRANVIFLFVAQPWKSMRKYGDRGMRFVLHEGGAMSMNVALATVAVGLGSVDCASVYEDEIHEALGIDGIFQTLLHAIVVGHPG